MSDSVLRFPIDSKSEQEIDMPDGALILGVHFPVDRPYLFALGDHSKPTVKRTIDSYYTNEIIYGPAKRIYIGTYQVKNTNKMMHVFERLNDFE